jgi:hypothetical protein
MQIARSEVEGPHHFAAGGERLRASMIHCRPLSFASKSLSVSCSSFRCREFWLLSSCCSTLMRANRRLSFSRQRPASSALIRGWDGLDFSLASAC